VCLFTLHAACDETERASAAPRLDETLSYLRACAVRYSTNRQLSIRARCPDTGPFPGSRLVRRSVAASCPWYLSCYRRPASRSPCAGPGDEPRLIASACAHPLSLTTALAPQAPRKLSAQLGECVYVRIASVDKPVQTSGLPLQCLAFDRCGVARLMVYPLKKVPHAFDERSECWSPNDGPERAKHSNNLKTLASPHPA